jgi:hypothetical protein
MSCSEANGLSAGSIDSLRAPNTQANLLIY